MADEGTCLDHGLGIWEGDEFWPRQGEQSRIVLQNLLCVLWRECGSVVSEVLFDFLSDNFCQDEATNASRTEREHGFIQAPRGHNAPGQDI
jgi:hypothetical protein